MAAWRRKDKRSNAPKGLPAHRLPRGFARVHPGKSDPPPMRRPSARKAGGRRNGRASGPTGWEGGRRWPSKRLAPAPKHATLPYADGQRIVGWSDASRRKAAGSIRAKGAKATEAGHAAHYRREREGHEGVLYSAGENAG